MATILTKKSDTASSVPLVADLTNAAGGAELAVNTADKRLFTKTSGGAVVELGTNPSSMTLPNGTANGVPYLNASKVLTSGSALTFDGTTFGVGGRIGFTAFTADVDDYGLWVSSATNATTLASYSTTPIAFRVNNSEQMRLTSTGLGIGTSSPSDSLHIKRPTYSTVRIEESTVNSNIYLQHHSGANEARLTVTGAYPLVFKTSDVERMRIDSSGNLLVGTTSPLNNGKLSVNQTNASYDAVVSVVASTSQSFYSGIYGGNFKYYVLGSGQINAIFTSITAISDRRAKTNIQDIRYGLNEILALRPVTFDHIDSVAADSVDNYGFIADEVEQILPQLVSESLNKANDGTPYQTLKMGDILPVLVKAIQEQQAIIDQLKADVAALKAAP